MELTHNEKVFLLSRTWIKDQRSKIKDFTIALEHKGGWATMELDNGATMSVDFLSSLEARRFLEILKFI